MYAILNRVDILFLRYIINMDSSIQVKSFANGFVNVQKQIQILQIHEVS